MPSVEFVLTFEFHNFPTLCSHYPVTTDKKMTANGCSQKSSSVTTQILLYPRDILFPILCHTC